MTKWNVVERIGEADEKQSFNGILLDMQKRMLVLLISQKHRNSYVYDSAKSVDANVEKDLKEGHIKRDHHRSAMTTGNLKKLFFINAQLRFITPKKVSADDNLVEYDARLLDWFLDILQDLHGKKVSLNIKKVVVSLGFPIKSLTGVLNHLNRHSGELYMWTNDETVLVRENLLNASCFISNGFTYFDEVRFLCIPKDCSSGGYGVEEIKKSKLQGFCSVLEGSMRDGRESKFWRVRPLKAGNSLETFVTKRNKKSSSQGIIVDLFDLEQLMNFRILSSEDDFDYYGNSSHDETRGDQGGVVANYGNDVTPEINSSTKKRKWPSYVDIGDGAIYKIPSSYDKLVASLNVPSFSVIHVENFYLKGTLDLRSLAEVMASDRRSGARSRNGMGESRPQYESLQARVNALLASNSNLVCFSLKVSKDAKNSVIPKGAIGSTAWTILSEGGVLQVHYVKVLKKRDTYESVRQSLPKKLKVKNDPSVIEKT